MSGAHVSTQTTTVRLECEELLLRRMLRAAIQSVIAVSQQEERAIADEFVRMVRRGERATRQPLEVHPYFRTEE